MLIPATVFAPLMIIALAFAPVRLIPAAEQAELIWIPSTGVVPEINIPSVTDPAEMTIPVVIAVADRVIPVVNVPVPCIFKPDVTTPVDVQLISNPAPNVMPVGIVALNAASAAAVDAKSTPTT